MLLRLPLLALLTTLVHGLHFILEGTEQKCFIEELPKDTTVLGKYAATEWNPTLMKYQDNAQQIVLITVE
ncbi:emp24p/erv25p- protein, partial [Rhizoclosmatium hyalinum]